MNYRVGVWAMPGVLVSGTEVGPGEADLAIRSAISMPADRSTPIRLLSRVLASHSGPPIRLLLADGTEAELPAPIYDVLDHAARYLARGEAVRVARMPREICEEEAARLPEMPMSSLASVFDRGKLNFTTKASGRFIRLTDLVTYRERRVVDQPAALAEMARDAQETQLYSVLYARSLSMRNEGSGIHV